MSDKKNIFFFTGEEQFLLYQEIKRWKSAFIKTYGMHNFFSFTGENMDPQTVIQTIYGSSLLVQRKLVVLFGIPTDSEPSNKVLASKTKIVEEYIMSPSHHIPADSMVVFVSIAPDKRTKFFKYLDEHATKKTFPLLSATARRDFISNIAGELLDSKDIDYLVETVGQNLYTLQHETQKIISYCRFNNITKISRDQIDKITVKNIDENSFALMDNLLVDNKKTFSVLENIQKQGEDFQKINGLFLWGLKGMLLINDCYQSGITDAKQIMSKVGLPPFVVAKTLKQISQISEQKHFIKNLYKGLITIDFSIKTGQIPADVARGEMKKLLRKAN